MKILSSLMMVGLAAQAFAAPSVVTKYRLQNAETMRYVQGSANVALPSVFRGDRAASDETVFKTVFLVKVANTMNESLEAFHKTCQPEIDMPGPRPLHQPGNTSIRPFPPRPPHPPVEEDECLKQRHEVGRQLQTSVKALSREQMGSARLSGNVNIAALLDLTSKLAQNMIDAKAIYPFHHKGLEMRALASASVGGGLNVTSGGAMDINHFRKVVGDGQVPAADSLPVEGLLKEFDLSLAGQSCDKLVCVFPAVAVDSKLNKLYVQIGMGSNVDESTFERKPLNLSVVLDISGSMSATDNTGMSRLEWAKVALTNMIQMLGEDDVLSIVLFDTKSETLVEPTHVTNRAELIAKVESLKTRGSTNMEAGLRDGFNFVSENLVDLSDYEHRVVLISDAGLNTGVTDQASFLKLISDFGNEGIGLTAVGLGLNFNQDFIKGITESKGGNYIFVHSGLAMAKYFGVIAREDGTIEKRDAKRFDFLVTPVAYNFKATVEVNGVPATLVKAYGVPSDKKAGLQELVDIQTLFFSKEGGAILLEYDLNE